MTKVIYIDTFSGISGDMLIGALIDVGFDIEKLREEIDRIGINAVLHVERVKKGGIEAVNFTVSYDQKKEKPRNYKTIRGMLEEKMAPSFGKDIALKVFMLLAEAEAKVHGIDVDDVHFHEVGAVDSIVDIVGVGLGFQSINSMSSMRATKILCSAVSIGSGFVMTQHGKLPVPAPATMELLKGIPVEDSGILGENVTPTGAAVLKGVVEKFGGIPSMVPEKVGYGAGDKTFENRDKGGNPPNLLRLVVGDENLQSSDHSFLEDEVLVITTNIDDMNPQYFEVIMEKLFRAGALDVTLTPLIMKKGRPGTELTVITDPESGLKMTEIILKESPSSGVRYKKERRYKLKRWIEKVETTFGPVNVKFMADVENKILRVSPEYEEIKAISKKSGLPIGEVYRLVIVDLDKMKDQKE